MKDFLKDNIVPLLATVIVVFTFILIPFLVFGPYPKERENLVFSVVGFLSGVVTSVTGFYFASSVGSSKKDDLIKKLTTNGPDQVA